MRRFLNGTYSGFLAVAFVLAGSTVVSLYNLERLETTTDDVLEARQARGQLTRLLDAVTDAETGQRGYLLTGDAVYLQPYHLGREEAVVVSAELPKQLGAVGLSSEDVALVELRAAVDSKLAELAETIRLFDVEGGAAALELVTTGLGLDQMAMIRSRGHEIRAIVNTRVESLERDSVDARRFALVSTLLTAVLTVLSVLGSFVMVERQNLQRQLATDRAQNLSRQLSALTDVAPRINRARDRASLLGLIATEARSILGVEVAAVRINGDHPVGAVAVGPRSRALEPWSVADQPLPLGLEAESAGMLVELDSPLDQRHAELQSPQDIRSALAMPVRDRTGRVLGHLLVAEPTSASLAVPDRIALVQLAQIVSTAWENVELLDELQATAIEREHFMAMLGHELRNPLNVIGGAAQVLQRLALPGPQAEQLVGMLNRQTAFMRKLVDELLDVARLERGKIEVELQRVDLSTLVRRTVDDFDTAHDTEVAVEVPAVEVWVDGDRDRLRQCLDNLLDNARKFSNGTPIHVRVEVDEHAAVVEVVNHGKGLSPAELEVVFERYVQADHADRGGLGLGLALVRGLVELHGGSLSATSPGRGEGSTFAIRLPLMDAPAPSTAVAEPLPTARKVLVVDDRHDARFAVSSLLAADGHEVSMARSGDEAIQLARTETFNLVLTDIHMGDGLDGYGVARALRGDPRTAGLHIVALTGFGSPKARRTAMDAGFDEHLTKPVQLDAIRRVMNRGRAS